MATLSSIPREWLFEETTMERLEALFTEPALPALPAEGMAGLAILRDDRIVDVRRWIMN